MTESEIAILQEFYDMYKNTFIHFSMSSSTLGIKLKEFIELVRYVDIGDKK